MLGLSGQKAHGRSVDVSFLRTVRSLLHDGVCSMSGSPMWGTLGLCDVQLPHSNEDSLCFSHLVVHCSSCREHEVKQVLEQNCALRANVVFKFLDSKLEDKRFCTEI